METDSVNKDMPSATIRHQKCTHSDMLKLYLSIQIVLVIANLD